MHIRNKIDFKRNVSSQLISYHLRFYLKHKINKICEETAEIVFIVSISNFHRFGILLSNICMVVWHVVFLHNKKKKLSNQLYCYIQITKFLRYPLRSKFPNHINVPCLHLVNKISIFAIFLYLIYRFICRK